MPNRPTVCPTPGCPNLAPCPLHPRNVWAGNGSQRRADRGVDGSGWEQQRRNARTLRLHQGICHVCKLTGATIVDHVIPLAEGGADNEANRRPIHSACHATKTAAEAARARRRADAARDPDVRA